jgi:catechol 2,3-dioxygenase-like lactoylglutathione lyase family enzyme
MAGRVFVLLHPRYRKVGYAKDMIAHASLPVRDYKSAKDFYSKVLAPLGYTLTQPMDEYKVAGFNDSNSKNTDFWIGEKEQVVAGHIAFEAKNKQQVDDFYKAALAAGGKDNGAPGYRKEYWPGYYAAFIHDADGHNIEAVFYDYNEK